MELECDYCHARLTRSPKVVAKRLRGGASGSYCNSTCMQHQRRDRARYTIECLHCRKPIWSYVSQQGNLRQERKYCSKVCMDAHRSQPVICAACGKEFRCFRCITRKYCSKECARTARSTLSKACLYCGSTYIYLPRDAETSKFCSFSCKVKHEGLARRKANIDAMRRCQRANWRDLRLVALNRDGWKCTRCGSADDLIVHHIIKWRKTKDDSIGNLVTLCRKCHLTVEFGKDVPAYVQERVNGLR